MLYVLAWVLSEQGRFGEAESSPAHIFEIFDAIGLSRDAYSYVRALSNLAAALFAQRRYDDTKQVLDA